MRHVSDASHHDELDAVDERASGGAADAVIIKTARALLATILVLVGASLATRFAAHLFEDRGPGSQAAAAMVALRELFDVNKETNVPTWFSSGMLLACALLATGIATLVRNSRGPYVLHWVGLALGLAFLSLDESSELHERLNTPFAAVLGESARGPLRFAWVVPAILIVAAVGFTYLRFLGHLPTRTRQLLRAAAVLYLTGAVGMEMAGGIALDEYGAWTLYTLITTVEETLEMCGGLSFLLALLYLVRLDATPVGYRLRLHPALSGTAERSL